MQTNNDPRTVNLLLATFAGSGLPRTLSLPTQASTPICDVYATIFERLPRSAESLALTTVSNKQLLPSSIAPITSLLSQENDRILSLRLSPRYCGGKGGFGSQLRAAGGRMSSRKNRDRQNQNVNGSNRNLDGRRLRTVDEAKRLADYLTIKPEMEKREKEERKKRWQDIVETSERREDDIKSGKVGANGGRLDADYVENKELAETKTREAVLRAMRDGAQLERTGSETSLDQDEDDGEDTGDDSPGSSDAAGAILVETEKSAAFFGWDDDEELDSDDEEEQGGRVEMQVTDMPSSYQGKGKGKAV